MALDSLDRFREDNEEDLLASLAGPSYLNMWKNGFASTTWSSEPKILAWTKTGIERPVELSTSRRMRLTRSTWLRTCFENFKMIKNFQKANQPRLDPRWGCARWAWGGRDLECDGSAEVQDVHVVNNKKSWHVDMGAREGKTRVHRLLKAFPTSIVTWKSYKTKSCTVNTLASDCHALVHGMFMATGRRWARFLSPWPATSRPMIRSRGVATRLCIYLQKPCVSRKIGYIELHWLSSFECALRGIECQMRELSLIKTRCGNWAFGVRQNMEWLIFVPWSFVLWSRKSTQL